MSLNFNYNGVDLQVSDNRIVSNTEGLNSIGIRTSQTPRSYGDGVNVWAQNFEGRIISITGSVSSDTLANYRDNINEITRALTPDEGRNLTITYAGVTKTIFAYVLQQSPTPERFGRVSFNDISIQWICPDPFFKSNNLNSLDTGLAEITGFNIPFDVPFDIGASGNNVVTVNNAGDRRATPSFTIRAGGGITNPTITNNTTGDSIQIERSLSSGDVVTVSYDGNTVSVILNGSQNIFSDVNENYSEFIFLNSGNNAIAFNASTFDATAELTVDWRDTYSYF